MLEGWGSGAPIPTIGFFALLALPVLFAGALVTRGLLRAWAPGTLVERLIEPEEGGGAPRLVGWVAMLVLACALIAIGVFRATWMIADRGEFGPLVVGFAEPVIAVACAVVVFAASRPLVDLFAAGARRIDRRWRRDGRSTLLRPRAIAIGAAATIAVIAIVVWFAFVTRRLGPFDTSIVYAPLLAILVTVLAHVAIARARGMAERGSAKAIATIAGAAAGVLALGAIAFAMMARANRPSEVIEIWGDRPLAGAAVELIYDIDEIRADISLAEFRPVDRPGAAHPDLVLITIDSMRAQQTPPYGGTAAMPVLAGLGESGAVFEWAFAPSNVTRRSIPSMVIGYAPNRIRGRVVGWALRVDPRFVLLAERLAAGGYETAGFVCCAGFWGPEARTGLQRGLEHLIIEHDGKELGGLARDWLAKREAAGPRRPLFAWVHILEPHNWTHGGNAPTTREARDQLYNRALAQADQILSQILMPFAGRDAATTPIVIVTADHGEALGDHGQPFHSTDLYNSQIRVPFVIAGPGIPAARLGETVSLTDLTPTIVELAGFQAPADLDGRSLADAITGKRPSTPDTGTAFAAMIKDRSNPGGLSAFVRGRWKLIASDTGVQELYDIHADPQELTNVAAQRPELVRELAALLEAKLAAANRSPF